MSDLNLKPCPFCGGPAELWRDPVSIFYRPYVRCKDCGAMALSVGYFIRADMSNDEEAVFNWNRRVKEEIPNE